ncbi:MAG: O-antigen ligase family protein [Bacteroidota bacterium]
MDAVIFLCWVYTLMNRLFVAQISSISLLYFEWLGLGLFYIIIRNLNSAKQVFLLYTIMISGFLQAVYGLQQVYGYSDSLHHLFKITGGFFNPGPYSGFILTAMPVTLCFLVFKWQNTYWHNSQENLKFDLLKKMGIHVKIGRLLFYWIPLCSFLLMLVVLPATQSRASWIGALGIILYIANIRFGLWGKLKVLLKKRKNLAVIAGILIVAVFTSAFIALYQLKKEYADGRLLIWRVTIEMIAEKPFFGHGFEMFKGKYMNHQASYFLNKEDAVKATMLADDNRYVFNDFLKTWVEKGVLGLVLVLTILGFAFHSKSQKGSSGQALFLLNASKSSLFGIVVFAVFSYPSEILPIKVNLIVFLSVLAANSPDIFRCNAFSHKRIRILKSIFVLALCLASFKVPSRGQTFNTVYAQWQTALSTYSLGAHQSSVVHYESIYEELKQEGEFLGHYGKALSVTGNHVLALEILKEAEKYMNNSLVQIALGDTYKALGRFHEAETAYLQAYHMVPVRFFPLFQLANLYYLMGDFDKALNMAHTILKKEVKIPSSAIEEMKTLMKKMIDDINEDSK